MIDVGAHTGSSFKPYLRQSWRVFAYEPDSTKHPKLNALLPNPLLSLSQHAVADVVQSAAQFYTSPESTGIASLVPFRASHTPAESVPVTTLAIEIQQHRITHIDYLKIDTEGFDLQVLKGHNFDVAPEVIMCEFDEIKTRPQHFGHHAIGKLLLEEGYAVFCSQWAPLVRYGSGHTWHCIARYPCELHHPDAWGNYIALHPRGHLDTLTTLLSPHV